MDDYKIIPVGERFAVERNGQTLPIGKRPRLFQFREHAEEGVALDKQVLAEGSETPDLDRLKARLFDNPNFRVRNFNAFWGPKAHTMTPDQLAAEINRALDQPGTLIEGEMLDNWEAPHPSADQNETLAAEVGRG